MKTLLLDLGTHIGWALLQEAAHLESGTLHLAGEEELELKRREGREHTIDIRFARIHAFIVEHIRQGVTRIVFEDVGFASTRMQTQLWASLRTAIWAAALAHPDVRFLVCRSRHSSSSQPATRAPRSRKWHRRWRDCCPPPTTSRAT